MKDPATADLLCPDNVLGCKRLCVDTGYFETYNLPHVKLVDVSRTPIERFTAAGIEARRQRHIAKREWLLAAMEKLNPAEQQTLIAAAALIKRLAEP